MIVAKETSFSELVLWATLHLALRQFLISGWKKATRSRSSSSSALSVISKLAGGTSKLSRTLTTPVKLIGCLKSIRKHAFSSSPFPVIITLEDHLTANLHAKVAQGIRR
ncbi:hypothetical protein F2P56_030289 [Juglans regia]|uniref:Phosphatidylinositol-specific phospholipase C X domain-containing protein n=1 Tax=Juglans regia TaxID=51240 RepID=A0A833WHN6_JUGRE|nr:hypothetical protein F2P56_030289 [Juglans regia]